MSRPRTPNEHLTEKEIDFIRSQHTDRRRPDHVAQALRCSVRTIKEYYAKFDGKVRAPKRYVTAPISKPPSDKPPRAPAKPNLYTSNFEPT